MQIIQVTITVNGISKDLFIFCVQCIDYLHKDKPIKKYRVYSCVYL